jgi:WD40 repeat protein
MPAGKPPLAPAEIDLIQRWIAEGAINDSPVNDRPAYDAQHPPRYARPPAITSIDFSPDGSWLAVAGHHEILLHPSDGSGLAARLIGLSERIQSVRFSPDGKLLAAAGGQPSRLGEIQIWDVEKRLLKTSVAVGYDTVYGVSWSPDGRWVAFGCPDKTVRAIEASTGKPILHQMAHEDWVLDTVFSTNGTHVISVGRDMTAKLTDVATQRFIDNITSITPGALRGGLLGVARHPSRDEILVGGSDGLPQVFQVFRQAARKIGDNATLLRRFPEMEGRVFGVDYSPDGNLVAACASLDSHGAVNLYAAKFDPTIPEVLLKAYQKTSGEYTAEEREAIQRFTTADVKLLHHIAVGSAPVYTLSFSPDGRRVAAGTGAGNILMIGVESGLVEMVFAAAPIDDDSSASPFKPLSAPAATLMSKDVHPAEEAPTNAGIARLAVVPDRLHFTSRNERVQLLVTATNDAGESFDVTRHAAYSGSSNAACQITVSAHGLVTLRPTPNLDAHTDQSKAQHRLVIAFGGQSVEVPIDPALRTSAYNTDFVRDVNPVLNKLGCSAGTCHGSREGRAGFKLSLRGYDPIFDVRALTDDLAARRVNLASPDESLMLLKATAAVPHEGGQRMTPDSEAYGILRQWIADGARLDSASPKVASITLMPQNPVVQKIGSRQQIRVVATYGDGPNAMSPPSPSSKAATGTLPPRTPPVWCSPPCAAAKPRSWPGSRAAYAATTLTVMGDRSGFAWADPPANNRIDELVAAKWKRMKILPSDLCSDAEFVRRVSLDLTGLPPTAAEVREFLANPRDRRSKRDALIERLLNSPDYVDHWANKWADLLQVNRKFLGEEGASLFRDWIRREIAANTPYDQFVRRLLTATGSNKDNPAAPRTGKSCANPPRRWRPPPTSSSPRGSTATNATTTLRTLDPGPVLPTLPVLRPGPTHQG